MFVMTSYDQQLKNCGLPFSPQNSHRNIHHHRFFASFQGDKMSGETAHRDVAKFKLPEDEIFGGWLNLDTGRGLVGRRKVCILVKL